MAPVEFLGMDPNNYEARSAEARRARIQHEEIDKELNNIRALRQAKLAEQAAERKRDMELLRHYDPWGKPGAGAPHLTVPYQKLDTEADSQKMPANSAQRRGTLHGITQGLDPGRTRPEPSEQRAYKEDLDSQVRAKQDHKAEHKKYESKKETEMLQYDPYTKPGDPRRTDARMKVHDRFSLFGVDKKVQKEKGMSTSDNMREAIQHDFKQATEKVRRDSYVRPQVCQGYKGGDTVSDTLYGTPPPYVESGKKKGDSHARRHSTSAKYNVCMGETLNHKDQHQAQNCCEPNPNPNHRPRLHSLVKDRLGYEEEAMLKVLQHEQTEEEKSKKIGGPNKKEFKKFHRSHVADPFRVKADMDDCLHHDEQSIVKKLNVHEVFNPEFRPRFQSTQREQEGLMHEGGMEEIMQMKPCKEKRGPKPKNQEEEPPKPKNKRHSLSGKKFDEMGELIQREDKKNAPSANRRQSLAQDMCGTKNTVRDTLNLTAYEDIPSVDPKSLKYDDTRRYSRPHACANEMQRFSVMQTLHNPTEGEGFGQQHPTLGTCEKRPDFRPRLQSLKADIQGKSKHPVEGETYDPWGKGVGQPRRDENGQIIAKYKHMGPDCGPGEIQYLEMDKKNHQYRREQYNVPPVHWTHDPMDPQIEHVYDREWAASSTEPGDRAPDNMSGTMAPPPSSAPAQQQQQQQQQPPPASDPITDFVKAIVAKGLAEVTNNNSNNMPEEVTCWGDCTEMSDSSDVKYRAARQDYLKSLKTDMEEQKKRKDENEKNLKYGGGELATVMKNGQVGKPKRDPNTGMLVDHHLGTSDITKEQTGTRPQKNEQSQLYHTELERAAEDRKRNGQLEKLKDSQESRQDDVTYLEDIDLETEFGEMDAEEPETETEIVTE